MYCKHVLSWICIFSVLILPTIGTGHRFKPTWDSLDTRVAPSWYDEAKFGIFIHWGVFSVPSYKSEWFWDWWKLKKKPDLVEFMKKNYPPDFEYADFAHDFTAEFYDPDQWTDLFKDAGAKYVVFVAKHHEGFTNWPSKASFNWNSMDVGPHRDIVGELAASVRNRSDIHFGLYHSLFEWFNPLFLQDKANKFKTNDFVQRKTMPELYELVNKYKPEVIWSDGDARADPINYWNATEFIAWLYNDSPVKDSVLVNDRWGHGVPCKHGDFFNCNDRYNPGVLVPHKWENCMTIDRGSWGYRRDARVHDMLTTAHIIHELAETVSCGGNLLLNVGPTKDGTFIPYFEERLREIGSWLKLNGEAIYATKPWSSQNDTLTKNVWYTKPGPHAANATKESNAVENGDTTIYAILLEWPESNQLYLGSAQGSSQTEITLLGYNGDPFPWKVLSHKLNSGMTITIPAIPFDKVPCKWAWVLKITHVTN